MANFWNRISQQIDAPLPLTVEQPPRPLENTSLSENDQKIVDIYIRGVLWQTWSVEEDKYWMDIIIMDGADYDKISCPIRECGDYDHHDHFNMKITYRVEIENPAICIYDKKVLCKIKPPTLCCEDYFMYDDEPVIENRFEILDL